jgi:hypothetical protein
MGNIYISLSPLKAWYLWMGAQVGSPQVCKVPVSSEQSGCQLPHCISWCSFFRLQITSLRTPSLWKCVDFHLKPLTLLIWEVFTIGHQCSSENLPMLHDIRLVSHALPDSPAGPEVGQGSKPSHVHFFRALPCGSDLPAIKFSSLTHPLKDPTDCLSYLSKWNFVTWG